MEKWREGYLRAVLDFIGAPDDVDLTTVTITGSWEAAWGYSEYTNDDAHTNMTVTYIAPSDIPPTHDWGRPISKGEVIWRDLQDEEVAALINSF